MRRLLSTYSPPQEAPYGAMVRSTHQHAAACLSLSLIVCVFHAGRAHAGLVHLKPDSQAMDFASDGRNQEELSLEERQQAAIGGQDHASLEGRPKSSKELLLESQEQMKRRHERVNEQRPEDMDVHHLLPYGDSCLHCLHCLHCRHCLCVPANSQFP